MDEDIIIIDDKIHQVEVLIKEFSKNKIPVKYFNGDYKDLPEKPIFSPRLVFLDLYLEDTVTEPKTVFSRCISILKQLLCENCNYILCIWTTEIDEYRKESELSVEKFNSTLRKYKLEPEDIIVLEDKNASISSKELKTHTKNLAITHSENMFKVKARGKILELALDIEKELDLWISRYIINDREINFYEDILVNANILDFSKKFRIFKKYYKTYPHEVPSDCNLSSVKESDIIGIRNAFAHQGLGEKILIIASKTKEVDLNFKELAKFIDFLIEQKEIISKFNV